MDPQELVPLESGLQPRARPSRQISHIASRSCYKGPIKLCRLLALVIILPTAFIVVPLYMRYRVFSGQMYPMSMTDMRLIDSKISPTWCQRQVVRSNTTFNAFVVPGQPELTNELVQVSMTRQLELDDDMKEYWGFYLLKGSTVTVSACVRWPGASLIMIKGYKHLKDCAYIGDDSSEELDELLELHKRGVISDALLAEKKLQLNKQDGKANDPDRMKRHKAGVSFHDPKHDTNVTSSDAVPSVDVTDHDSKELRELLEGLHALRQAAKMESLKNYHPPPNLVAVPGLHRHRDTNVDKDERRWLSFKDIDGSDQVNKDNNTTTDTPRNNEKVKIVMNETNYNTTDNYDKMNEKKNYIKQDQVNEVVTQTDTNGDTHHVEDEVIGKPAVTERKLLVSDKQRDDANKEEPNSREVFEEVLKQLEALGDRGKRVLVRLHETMGVNYQKESPNKTEAPISTSEEELDRLRRVLVEAIDEEKTKPERQQKRRDARTEARAKRELMLGQVELQKQLNEDDEARDYAAEEGLEPDGYAEHHSQLTENGTFDMSNSEFWSSFSSSEEALLECEGLILNLPLTPHAACQQGSTDDQTLVAARSNALTYRVPANGYYFFVFNSENEVQTNFIKARFDLQKTRYDVARTALRECKNSTDTCDLPLDIFSSQKVVLEVPLSNNDSMWNEQFVIISECEPRTSIYLACVIIVPILILAFGLQ